MVYIGTAFKPTETSELLRVDGLCVMLWPSPQLMTRRDAVGPDKQPQLVWHHFFTALLSLYHPEYSILVVYCPYGWICEGPSS